MSRFPLGIEDIVVCEIQMLNVAGAVALDTQMMIMNLVLYTAHQFIELFELHVVKVLAQVPARITEVMVLDVVRDLFSRVIMFCHSKSLSE